MNENKIIAESIAKEYLPNDDSKIIALKKLDAKAKLPANIFTYAFGIVSALVVGVGMCLAMEVIGGGLFFMILGIVIGIVGFVGCGINYPIYKKLINAGKSKYAYDIIKIAREISNESEK